MTTSNAQYAPVFLPGEAPSLKQKTGRTQSTGSQRVRHNRSDPACIDARQFLLWASLPQWELGVKVKQLLACRDPSGTKYAGTWTASAPGVMALSESFLQASCSWWSEGLFGQSLSVALPIWALRGLTCLGSFSVVRCIRHIVWLPQLGFYSVVHCVRCLMGPLSIVQLPILACGRREAMLVAPPPTHDSTVSPCFHGCLAFLQRHFPPHSAPSHPLSLSLCSQQQSSPWGCSIIPKLQLPATEPSRGSTSLWGCVWLQQRLSHSHSI